MIKYENFTIEEKIGQMMMFGFRGTEARGQNVERILKELKPGGIWITDNDSPLGLTFGNIKSREQVTKLTHDLQEISATPLFIAIDAEGGKVIRLKEKYGFPPTLSAKFLGDEDNIDKTFNEYEKIALLLKELGINLNFAPVVDLLINKENIPLAKKERCYGEDPQLVIRHAEQVINSHRKHKIITVIKHFPGHGSSGGDTHENHVDVSNTWQERELLPYKHFITTGLAESVLSAHVFLKKYDDKLPGTLSKNILTGLLREELGFNGLVITDDMNMGAIAKNYDYDESIVMAVNAGADIILQGNVMNYDINLPDRTFNAVLNAVKNGQISEGRINDSFERIVSAKLRYDILQ